MSTLRVDTIENSAGGSAINVPGAAKAWVNFNGTGTVAIRDSLNVSSITDNGTGDYTVNFTSAMTDTNYSVNATVSIASIQNTGWHIGSSAKPPALTTTSVKVYTKATSTVDYYDADVVCVSIFR
jgi:hypothetical protein